jgi:hypothetical protein
VDLAIRKMRKYAEFDDFGSNVQMIPLVASFLDISRTRRGCMDI